MATRTPLTEHPKPSTSVESARARAIAIVRARLAGSEKTARLIQNLPPDELVLALRSPAGAPRIVALHVDGSHVVADVNPNGHIDREAEQRAWECIQNIARSVSPDAAAGAAA
ncbi:hypothetical protein JOL79_11700 [Microbispora sp. RL4-1S]|uniref:Uncharacterized protein n=1 Tax=Microbispora oryzae TaxID=2806554 RepID=A0A940WF47_9ACTN|nr:hypothetical protein [Microbispora oryzae]MBP2704479.1 hypothetical protein [Microbispora oryzae]